MTSGPSQVELVTLAVYLLGGAERRVDTEDVAVKAHELAPTRFSWRKYPEQINLELVRVYLSAAKSVARSGLLDGSGKTGWSLTPKGVQWAQSEASRLVGGELDRRREETAGGPLDEQRWRRQRERVTRTRAWLLWTSGTSEVSARDAADVFRIDSYADARMRTLKIARLRKLFDRDEQVGLFLQRMSAILESGELGK